jgi:hypothetical protein
MQGQKTEWIDTIVNLAPREFVIAEILNPETPPPEPPGGDSLHRPRPPPDFVLSEAAPSSVQRT